MKYLLKLIASTSLLVPTYAWAGMDPWVHHVPQGWWSNEPIPVAYFHEVVASKLAIAQAQLKKDAVVPIEGQEGGWYAGAGFSCPEASKSFLVRAVYGFAGTGSFTLYQKGSSLLVAHGSLGRSNPVASHSAIVVCLSSAPEELYVDYSVAE